MPETQIKVEILEFYEVFPYYLKFLKNKLKINSLEVKKYKGYFIVKLNCTNEEIFNLIENLYNFRDIFKIQKISYNYK